MKTVGTRVNTANSLNSWGTATVDLDQASVPAVGDQWFMRRPDLPFKLSLAWIAILVIAIPILLRVMH